MKKKRSTKKKKKSGCLQLFFNGMLYKPILCKSCEFKHQSNDPSSTLGVLQTLAGGRLQVIKRFTVVRDFITYTNVKQKMGKSELHRQCFTLTGLAYGENLPLKTKI